MSKPIHTVQFELNRQITQGHWGATTSILKEHEARASAPELSRRCAVAENTCYRWKPQFGVWKCPRRSACATSFRTENAPLKRLLAAATPSKSEPREQIQGKMVTAGRNGAKGWDGGVPDYVECQVQHQLAVTGKAAADVCVLICGQELRVHRIERNEAVIERLVELERAFWRYVETDTPPPTDGSDSAGRALRGLYPSDRGETIVFEDDEPLCDAFDRLLGVRAELDRLRDHENRLKQQIQTRMGDASRAIFPHGEVSWQRSRDRQTLDVDRLLADQPELMEQYPLTRPGMLWCSASQ